jgi:hypothetical protein
MTPRYERANKLQPGRLTEHCGVQVLTVVRGKVLLSGRRFLSCLPNGVTQM